MAYGMITKIKKELPRKLKRKAMLNKTSIKSYDKNNKLTPSMILKLQEHSKHHTASHIRMMVRMMGSGTSFSQAHNETMKKMGK